MSNVRSDCMLLEVGLDIPSTQRGAPASRVTDKAHPSTRLDAGSGRFHAGASIVGGRRSKDRDAWAAQADLGVFLVADGRGGPGTGAAAARLALSTVERVLSAPCTMDPLAAALAETFGRLGASLVALRVVGSWVVTASVGDGRVYRLRPGAQSSASGPDSRARGGVLSRRAPASRLQGLGGGGEDLDVHVEYSAHRAGDLFLLCSDSVTADLDDATLRALLAADSASLEARCDELLYASLAQGGVSDATALLVQL
jgi:protein phosphatase